MAVDVRLRLWRLFFKTKEPPPEWRRNRRGAMKYLSDKLRGKKKRSTQSLWMNDA